MRVPCARWPLRQRQRPTGRGGVCSKLWLPVACAEMEREAQSLGYLVALAVAGGRNDNRSLVVADPTVVAMHVPVAHGDDGGEHDGLD